MLFAAIKNSLKLLMATIVVLILTFPFSINVSVVLISVMFLLGIGYVVISTLESRPKPLPLGPNGEIPDAGFGDGNEQLTDKQIIVEGFINDVLEHCSRSGENCTLMNQPDGLWVVKVDDNTGAFEKLVNLALPNEKDVTKENVKALLKRVCDEIDVKIQESKSTN